MSSQCRFLTESERKIVEFLKDGPKQRKEIIENFGKKRKTTTERLLRKMEEKRDVFRVPVYDNVFYRLNTFPQNILMFFTLADELNSPGLLKAKEEILKHYPNNSFEHVLKKHRTVLELTKAESKSIIQVFKDFEGEKYEKTSSVSVSESL